MCRLHLLFVYGIHIPPFSSSVSIPFFPSLVRASLIFSPWFTLSSTRCPVFKASADTVVPTRRTIGRKKRQSPRRTSPIPAPPWLTPIHNRDAPLK
uniref:Secreted protein n=1 Tax=Meloidogyne incognita TaxID=6306 RepID=A0A914LVC0_MELIC